MINIQYQITLDYGASGWIKKTKNDLYKEGKTYDTDFNTITDYTYSGFISKHTCSLNNEEYQRI